MSENNPRALVAWQGIAIEVPTDWSLASISGDEKSGYYRVSSPGTAAIEVRWSEASEKVDLGAKLDTYLKDLDRKSRKQKLDFQSKVREKDGDLRFMWRADRKAEGRLFRCPECKRAVIVQVSGVPGDPVSAVSSFVLPSVRDHAEGGWRTWAMYDLQADVPPGYKLEKHKLMAGYLQLQFRRGANQLIIERWGLANIALKKATLAEWFRERMRTDLTGFTYKVEELTDEPEPAVQAIGRRSGILGVYRTIGDLTKLRVPAMRLDTYAWACEESNKIYSAQSMHTAKERILDDVIARVECH